MEKNLKEKIYENAYEDGQNFMDLCTKIIEAMTEPEPTQEELEKILFTNY